MPDSKATIVLLHGGCHSASTWDRTMPHLQGKGYRCITPQLCLGGSENPVTSYGPAIVQVQTIIAEEISAGHNVMLVNHSLGGLVGCSAVRGFTASNPSNLDGRSGQVIGIVQITAVTLRDGAPLEEGRDPESIIQFEPGENGLMEVKNAKEVFYNDMEPEDANYWNGKLLPNSAWIGHREQDVYAGWKDVPVWYVMCSRDKAISPAVQESMVDMIREANPDVTTRTLDASHSPMLSKPLETATIIDEAASAFIALKNS